MKNFSLFWQMNIFLSGYFWTRQSPVHERSNIVAIVMLWLKYYLFYFLSVLNNPKKSVAAVSGVTYKNLDIFYRKCLQVTFFLDIPISDLIISICISI